MESGDLEETNKKWQCEGYRPLIEFCDGNLSVSGDIKWQGKIVWQD
jgi:hypothetical protein